MEEVKPFCGKKYHENSRTDVPGTYPCVICGKPVYDARNWVVVVEGGAAFGNIHSDDKDSGFMGYWPVGDGCYRKYRKQLKPFVLVLKKGDV